MFKMPIGLYEKALPPPLTVPENSEFYSSLTLHFELK